MAIGGITYTKNYQFSLIAFDTRFWQDYMNANFNAVDALLFSFIGYVNYAGTWKNSTAYTTGQVVASPDDGLLYICLQNNTSAGTGTFAQDRLARPTLWGLQSAIYAAVSVWAPATAYRPGQFVTSGLIWAVCKGAHTSTNSFSTDVANGYWSVLVDATVVQQWATLLAAQVQATDYSAKEYAIGVTAPLGSAKSWATSTVVVAGGFKGSYGYALDAAASAAAAQAAVGGVKVTISDTTPAPLTSKLILTGVTGTVVNPGANEQLQVNVPLARAWWFGR